MLSKVMKQAILSPLIAISVVLLLSLNASAQGENGIVEPADGSVVGGYVTVRGIANHSEFKKFQLDLLLFGVEEDATFIHRASGRKVRVSNLTAFDSSKYPDGEHRLRLRVVRDGMNYDEYFTTLVIDNSNNVDSGSGSGITRPQDGSTVGRLVNVLGIARDRNFRKWQLELLPFGDANSPIFVSWNRRERSTSSRLAELDTTLFPDGTHTLRLRVVRKDNTYEDFISTLTIDNSREITTEKNGFFEPEENAVVSGEVRVRGIADHPEFKKWQLDLLIDGDENQATFVAWNRNPRPTRGNFRTFDTTQYPNGSHRLRLRVVQKDGNYDEFFLPITFDNVKTSQ
ncbi:hypothetical protein KFU94_53960 [Chloroflexi bacterium TSY]|nr:hypothetical protein [Chloroflexi bacterium TSY]